MGSSYYVLSEWFVIVEMHVGIIYYIYWHDTVMRASGCRSKQSMHGLK